MKIRPSTMIFQPLTPEPAAAIAGLSVFHFSDGRDLALIPNHQKGLNSK
jgi:hypothetical protein